MYKLFNRTTFNMSKTSFTSRESARRAKRSQKRPENWKIARMSEANNGVDCWVR